MAGIQIQSLPTASTLTGSELAVVSQNNITKKTTIDDINAAPLAAASDAASDATTALSAAQAAQGTANTAQSTANTAQSTANTANTTANTAQSTANTANTTANTANSTANTALSTANGKLSTVAVDGTTITGNGTVGNPLVANVGSSVKEYRGYLTISGGGVTFTSLQNDVGNIVWTNPSNGLLYGTLNGAFLSNKFWGISGSLNGGSVPYFTDVQRFFDNVITVSIFKHDGTQTGTPFGTFPIHLIINN
jgi:hypothetical protein